MSFDQDYPIVSTITAYLTAQGIEIIEEHDYDFYTEWQKQIWRMLNRVEAAAALNVFSYSSGTIRVAPGKYTWKGTAKTYAGSSTITPTDDDVTYVWMQGDNTVASIIDGTGWPAEDHIKLAAVTKASGDITDIEDYRYILRGNTNAEDYSDIVCIGNEVVCVDNNVVYV